MRLPFLLAAAATVAWVQPAQAQRTEDEARLAFTMALTWTGSSDLWAVAGQPILRPGSGADSLDLDRGINGGIGVLFGASYFPSAALGLTGEIFFMGIGVEDACTVASAGPDPRTVELCTSINGARKSSSAVLVSVGGMYRIGANQPISPYVRGQAGVLVSNLSPIQMSGTVTDLGTGITYVIYEDPQGTRVTPGFVFGGGFTTPIGKGWQLRAEVRDNLVQIATVAGPTAAGIYEPEITNEWKNLWSVVIGADIVLEKKRGRRY